RRSFWFLRLHPQLARLLSQRPRLSRVAPFSRSITSGPDRNSKPRHPAGFACILDRTCLFSTSRCSSKAFFHNISNLRYREFFSSPRQPRSDNGRPSERDRAVLLPDTDDRVRVVTQTRVPPRGCAEACIRSSQPKQEFQFIGPGEWGPALQGCET